PEAAAAAYYVLPQPRLALMHTGRRAMAEGRSVVGGADALLIKGMARLVNGREQCISQVALIDPRGDADVAAREPRAEWVRGLVEAPAFEVVADAFRHAEREVELRAFRKGAAQTGVLDDG